MIQIIIRWLGTRTSGSLALASAIAFGLGGRQVASRILESLYEQGAKNLDQVRRDIEKGRSRAQIEAMLHAHDLPRKKEKDKSEY